MSFVLNFSTGMAAQSTVRQAEERPAVRQAQGGQGRGKLGKPDGGQLPGSGGGRIRVRPLPRGAQQDFHLGSQGYERGHEPPGAERFIISVRQGLRPDAKAVIAALKARRIGVEILSGDREAAVTAAAQALGVVEWRAGVTPADKIARIEELKARGMKVLMVGDGMNDAPSLAAAHVSMSPISAAHLSQATADLVFLGKPLAPVVAAIDFSRKALHLMRQNLWLAIGYNFLAVPIAISGVVTPLIAAAAMSGSSILVMLNALRARSASRRV